MSGRTGLLGIVNVVGLVLGAEVCFGQSAPVVSNVTASQRQDYSRRVDIRYDLASSLPCTVWAVVSDNGGSTWSVPAITFTGAVGPNISAGSNKLITWDAGADIPGKLGNFRVRVYADDGVNSDMVLVPAGDFPYQKTTPTFVPAFMIDRHEVTNQRYCEFLNSADPDGVHWDSRQEISRSGVPPSVFYAVNSGRANYPVRYVSYDDAAAMADWLSLRDGRTWRVPTEQEWEKAAAWDPSLQKHWTYGFLSDSIDCSWANYHTGSSYCVGAPTEVGHYNGTAGTNNAHSYFGCYDMSGNVWEWTSSWYTVNQYRVLRGGAWDGYAVICASTFRIYNSPSIRVGYYGFRLVLDPN